MKITRYKRVQRYLSFYRNNFNFHPPYQILIDATFCNAALNNKVNIAEQMPKYISDEVKLLTTVCVVNETEKLSKALYGAMLVVKQFPVHKCGHEKNPISASECLFSLVKKSADNHYFLATQDPGLTEKVRKLAYVPLIYLKMNTIVMEKPQDIAKDIAVKSQEETLNIDEHQFKTLKTLKRLEFGEEEAPKKKKKKGPKGPNPLSCKKKKVQQNPGKGSTSQTNQNKRKRKNRIPNHIKRMFNKIESDLNPQNSK